MRYATRSAIVAAVTAALALPAAAAADIAVTTACTPKQGQSGHVIRMSIWVEAAEPLTVDGHGKVRVRGKTYPLVPRFPTPRPMGAQEGLNFKLVPATAKIAAKVAHALNDGLEPKARGTLILATATEVEKPTFKTRFTR